MKNLAKFILFGCIFIGFGCDRELKEHPLPTALKEKIRKKADPKVQENEVTGTIAIDPALAGSIPPNGRLFVFARPEGVAGGPPLAVRRFSMVVFPFRYSIGQLNVMLEGNAFEGPLTLTARLDMDGDAKAGPGDILGRLNTQAGDKKADIVLNEMVKAKDLSVTGTLKLDPKLAGSLPATWKLFLIARPQGEFRGPPLAVQLLQDIEFPYQFTLGQENTMMPGARFEGPLTITARIDHDGNAKVSQGDLDGTLDAQAGDKNLEIVIDHVY